MRTFSVSAPAGLHRTTLHISFHFKKKINLAILLAAVSIAIFFFPSLHPTFTVLLIASFLFLLSVLWIGQDINQGALSNSPTLPFYLHKGVCLMQGHILLTRHYLADGYDGYGFDKKSDSSGWDVCVSGLIWYPEMGFESSIATCQGVGRD